MINNIFQQKMATHWEHRYKTGQTIWDRDYPSPLLVQSVEKGLINPCKVISIGCGSGTNEIYLAKLGFIVTGIDISPTALQLAKNKAINANVNIEWICIDILNLSNNLGEYDLIFDRGCYHHIRYHLCDNYIKTIIKLSHNDTKYLIISCNSGTPPGVSKEHIIKDFEKFKIKNLEMIESVDHNKNKRKEWLLFMIYK